MPIVSVLVTRTLRARCCPGPAGETLSLAAVEDRDPLADQPFTYLARADGMILIRYRAAPVAVLRGKVAARFLARVDGADAPVAPQLMARVTGNFKRGNEPEGKHRRR